MGLLRMGDPIGRPDTDIMVKSGIKYELDSIWTSGLQANRREKQLEANGKVVYSLERMAPPEEVMQHLHTRGMEDLGEEKVHLDGRYTKVFDVWVAAGRTYRRKQIVKPKVKMISIKNKKYSRSWEDWVGDDYATSRRKIYQKPKTNRVLHKKTGMNDITNGVIQVTKAGVAGTIGMGVVGMLGGMLRKKSLKIKPKTKRCRCKK
jgi:hypothetical protein